ncbi:MAG: ribonuclease D, partial [Gammaproteobacteria bacterium]|nr:ribonuclease D [Gammaproteobacteria bacterium]
MSDTPLITSDTALREVCQQLASSPFLAVDTEFVREYNYYPQLCLIQVASADFVVCIDPMGGLDLTPLRDILYAPQTVKVMHAAHQDLEAFYHLWSALPQPLFDTQVAAAFLGLGEQIGYAGLVKHFLHLDIDKSQTRTDWRKRPFTQKQLQYAADDVRHLARIYPEVCALL